MKKLLLATALAGLAGTAMAQDVVRLGTEGATLPTTSSTTLVKLQALSVSWAMRCASALA